MEIDEGRVAIHAQLLAMRQMVVKTFVRAFSDFPPDRFDSMADAWVDQLSHETYPHLGPALSDHLAAEVQETLEDMVRQAKLYRAEIERIASDTSIPPKQ